MSSGILFGQEETGKFLHTVIAQFLLPPLRRQSWNS